MQMRDRERAAFAVREAATGLGIDDLEMIEIGTEVLHRRVLSALHQPPLHLSEGIAGADVDGGRPEAGERARAAPPAASPGPARPR